MTMIDLAHRDQNGLDLPRFSLACLVIALPAAAQGQAGWSCRLEGRLVAMTSEWKGDRYADGRPKVADDLLQRMKASRSKRPGKSCASAATRTSSSGAGRCSTRTSRSWVGR